MSSLLPNINSPEDLKALDQSQLGPLAAEIRDYLLRWVTENGGHLASNLGVVELTIAMHRVFDTPKDKIVWDVGHQCYTHKLITGRKDYFPTLRKYGGLSGFPALSESAHDAFGTGHAGTSISAALGIALARDLQNKSFNVVAVIGDGSMDAGMAFEAVNHAGHTQARLIVILNDNGMAISPCAGWVSRVLNKVRFDPRFGVVKQHAQKMIARLPFGKSTLKLSEKVKNQMENFLLPSAFWTGLGYSYLGPIDGHNVEETIAALKWARDFESGPTLVHVITQKGKGYPPAENNATRFHGISPRKTAPGGTQSYSGAFGDAVVRLMQENKKIVAITAAMMDGTGLSKAAEMFPNRVFDVGICEQHAVTLAAGLAAGGSIPIVAIYSSFLQRAYDQIIHDVCLQNLPVVFAVDRAGLVGEDGKTHQGALDISFLRCIPNMIVAAPKDADELRHLLYTAVGVKRPIAIRYPRGLDTGAKVSMNFQTIPVGKAEELRDGEDLLILAIGSMVYPALEAAEKLQNDGISCAVVNVRFVKPLDSRTLRRFAARISRWVTVEENVVSGGLSSAVGEWLQREGLRHVSVAGIGLPDAYVEHGPQDLLRHKCDLDAPGICKRLLEAYPELKAGRYVQPHEGGR